MTGQTQRVGDLRVTLGSWSGLLEEVENETWNVVLPKLGFSARDLLAHSSAYLEGALCFGFTLGQNREELDLWCEPNGLWTMTVSSRARQPHAIVWASSWDSEPLVRLRGSLPPLEDIFLQLCLGLIPLNRCCWSVEVWDAGGQRQIRALWGNSLEEALARHFPFEQPRMNVLWEDVTPPFPPHFEQLWKDACNHG